MLPKRVCKLPAKIDDQMNIHILYNNVYWMMHVQKTDHIKIFVSACDQLF